MRLSAVALTKETLGLARRNGRKIFDEIRDCKHEAVMVSPETLFEPAMALVLSNAVFRENCVGLSMDEFHIIRPWGKEFRQAFHQLESIRWRLPPGVPVLGTSATMLPGKPFQEILNLLRIYDGQYHVMRQSNERPNIRSTALRLSHGLGGATFPDVAFTVNDGQKAVVYCESLSLTFRVAAYLRRLLPAGDARFTRVRQWTSLTSAEHNAETVRLFRDDVNTTVIVATIAFGMGINALRNIWTVIMLGVPRTVDNYKQQEGRAVRDLSTPGTGILYIQGTTWDRLRDGKAPSKRRAAPGKATAADDLDMEPVMSQYLTACIEKRCLIAEINAIYDNPGPDVSMDCIAASRRLPCSSCSPFSPPSPSSSPTMTASPPPAPVDRLASLPTPYKTNEQDRANVRVKLRGFARERWSRKRSNWIPFEAYWPGDSLEVLAAHFHRIRTRSDLELALAAWPTLLLDDGDALLEKLEQLNARMDERARRKKSNAVAKMLATKAKNKGTRLSSVCHRTNEADVSSVNRGRTCSQCCGVRIRSS
jgi:hypothetical protein